MMWLLDTNVISELPKHKASPDVVRWIESKLQTSLFVSEVTFAELRFGIERCAELEKRSRLEVWLREVVRMQFEDRSLAISENILFRWRLIAHQVGNRGRNLPQADALIAATAAEHRLVVCSRDVVPYQIAGVPVINPWTGERFNGA